MCVFVYHGLDAITIIDTLAHHIHNNIQKMSIFYAATFFHRSSSKKKEKIRKKLKKKRPRNILTLKETPRSQTVHQSF